MSVRSQSFTIMLAAIMAAISTSQSAFAQSSDRGNDRQPPPRPIADDNQRVRPVTPPEGGPDVGEACSAETPAADNARRADANTNGRINRNRARPSRNENANTNDRARPVRAGLRDNFGGDEPTWVDCPADVNALGGGEPGWEFERPGQDEFGGDDPGWALQEDRDRGEELGGGDPGWGRRGQGSARDEDEDEFGGDEPTWARDPEEDEGEDEREDDDRDDPN